jgi:hypothetical protein
MPRTKVSKPPNARSYFCPFQLKANLGNFSQPEHHFFPFWLKAVLGKEAVLPF